MYVISGKYRRKKIIGYETEGVRSTKSRVRESIMSMLRDDLAGAKILDLFAGTGIIGIEMISNGARMAVFNDINTKELIKKNLQKIVEPTEVYGLDAKVFLKQNKHQFDIIFVDAPYDYHTYDKLFRMIREENTLKNGGLLVVEAAPDVKLNVPYDLIKEKKFGNTRVYIFQANLD